MKIIRLLNSKILIYWEIFPFNNNFNNKKNQMKEIYNSFLIYWVWEFQQRILNWNN